jgi:hypothetical protein
MDDLEISLGVSCDDQDVENVEGGRMKFSYASHGIWNGLETKETSSSRAWIACR